MSRHVHKRSNTIASAVWEDCLRFIEPADIEVVDKLGARSFYVEKHEKIITNFPSSRKFTTVLKLQLKVEELGYMRNDFDPQFYLLVIYRPRKDD